MGEKRARMSSPGPALSSGADAISSKEPAPGDAKTAFGPSPASVTGMRQAYGPTPATGPENTTPASASGAGASRQTFTPAWRVATEEIPVPRPVPVHWLGAMKFLPRTTAFKRVSGLMKDNKVCADCRELYASQVVLVKECSTAPILIFESGHFKALKEVKSGIFKTLFKGCPATDSPPTYSSDPSASAQNPPPPSQSQPSPHQGPDFVFITTPAPASGAGASRQTFTPAWRVATEEILVPRPVSVHWLGAMKFLPRTTTFKRVSGLIKDNKVCADCRELYASQVVLVKECSTAPVLIFGSSHFKVVKELKGGIFMTLFKGCPATDSPPTDSPDPNAAAQNPVPPSQSQPSPHQGGAVVEEPH